MLFFLIYWVWYINNNESENSYDVEVDVGNIKLMCKCYVEVKYFNNGKYRI